jgi:hypothetical protein
LLKGGSQGVTERGSPPQTLGQSGHKCEILER